MGEVIVIADLDLDREPGGPWLRQDTALDVAVELADNEEALGGGDRLAFVGP
jgi:hypothetical protein